MQIEDKELDRKESKWKIDSEKKAEDTSNVNRCSRKRTVHSKRMW